MPPKRFTDEIETKICNEYKEGKNGVHLGYKYKCDPSIIYRVLKENNIPRINGKRLIKQEKETEICKKYLDGMSSNEIASEYGICGGTIIRVLKRNGINITKNYPKEVEQKRKFIKKIEIEICKKYLEGMSAPKLASLYYCDRGTIVNIIKRNGYKDKIRRHCLVLPEEEICYKYQKDKKTWKI